MFSERERKAKIEENIFWGAGEGWVKHGYRRVSSAGGSYGLKNLGERKFDGASGGKKAKKISVENSLLGRAERTKGELPKGEM